MPTTPDDIQLQGLTNNGKGYHLDASNNEIANHIIIVGDPDRLVSFHSFFDTIIVKGGKREMQFVTGTVGSKKLTVISSGMGTDNIDILLNELALVCTGRWNTLKILRLGTTGAVRAEIEPGTVICSKHALGLDGLLHHYQNFNQTRTEQQFVESFVRASQWPAKLALPYFTSASLELPVNSNVVSGITMTTNGFYAPQMRHLHFNSILGEQFFIDIQTLSYQELKICNFEMEMAGIFGLSKLFGFKSAGLCVALANRSSHSSVLDSKKLVDQLIKDGIEALLNAP